MNPFRSDSADGQNFPARLCLVWLFLCFSIGSSSPRADSNSKALVVASETSADLAQTGVVGIGGSQLAKRRSKEKHSKAIGEELKGLAKSLRTEELSAWKLEDLGLSLLSLLATGSGTNRGPHRKAVSICTKELLTRWDKEKQHWNAGSEAAEQQTAVIATLALMEVYSISRSGGIKARAGDALRASLKHLDTRLAADKRAGKLTRETACLLAWSIDASALAQASGLIEDDWQGRLSKASGYPATDDAMVAVASARLRALAFDPNAVAFVPFLPSLDSAILSTSLQLQVSRPPQEWFLALSALAVAEDQGTSEAASVPAFDNELFALLIKLAPSRARSLRALP